MADLIAGADIERGDTIYIGLDGLAYPCNVKAEVDEPLIVDDDLPARDLDGNPITAP